MSIYDLKTGDKGLIQSIGGDDKFAKRLLALGFIEGTEVKLIATAPLGDPIVINLRGFNLAIRKNDAKNICIRKA
ncbi:FeoA family protein [Clostridium psychrophilum]|uniref:FeoA family protein n=1 Tax=Clostridium psychrophilum TaxID=132926 RepID=UPI001C0E85C0|nr:ferrous iron transport protein A [Clostridium psychrophilum]MBU3182749.1 ferrous iron transport protein A [Clostridium psychrophilum]